VALSWISNEPFKCNVFVANRVSSIQELTAYIEWHHVPTALNPADVLSRATTPDQLALSEIWSWPTILTWWSQGLAYASAL